MKSSHNSGDEPHFVVSKEFLRAHDFFKRHHSMISEKTKQKLQVLAKVIEGKEVSFVVDINEPNKHEELRNLCSLPQDVCVQLYIDTIQSVFPHAHLYIAAVVKKGSLQVRSQTLKIWRERDLLLTFETQVMRIFSPNKNHDKVLDLNTYALRWIGERKGKFCFSMDSLTTKNKYKNFLLGSEDVQMAKDWHESIRISIADYNDNKKLDNDLEKIKELSPKRISNMVAKLKEKRKFDEVKKISHLEQRKSPSPPHSQDNTHASKGTTPAQSHAQHIEGKTDKPDDHSRDRKKTESGSKREVRSSSSASFGPEKENQDEYSLGRKNLKTSSIVKFEDGDPLSPRFADDRLRFKSSIKGGSRLEENSAAKETTAAAKEPLAFPSVLDSRELKDSCPQALLDLLEGLEYEKILDEDGFELVDFQGNSRILKHLENCNHFKLILNFGLPSHMVLQYIQDTTLVREWNSQISDIKILSVLDIGRTEILYEKRKPFGTLYAPRDFTYIRFIFEEQARNITTILQRTVEHTTKVETLSTSSLKPPIRGEISSMVYHVQNIAEKETLLVIDLLSSNKGFVSEEQDHEMTLRYLTEFKNIETLLKQKSYFKHANTSAVKSGEKKKYISESMNFQHPKEMKLTDSFDLDIMQSAPIKQGARSDSAAFYEEKKEDHSHNSEAVLEESLNVKKKVTITQFAPPVLDRESQNEIIESILGKLKEDEKTEKHNDAEEDEEFEDAGNSSEKKKHRKTSSLGAIERGKGNSIGKSENSGNSPSFQTVDLNFVKNNRHIHNAISNKYVLGVMPDSKPKYQETSKEKGHYALRHDWTRLDKGGLAYHNKQVMEAQKKVLGFLLKKMGSNIVQGKSVMSISLPIEIFDTLSQLERMAGGFTYAPTFLQKAADSEDPLERLKYTITFFNSVFHMSAHVEKPFNPILGETFQARINGVPLYAEQISHHPPISVFTLISDDYQFIGCYECVVNLHANSVIFKFVGQPYVKFLKGMKNKICFVNPLMNISGTSFGQRTMNFEGKCFAYDAFHRLYCELDYNPDKKGLIGSVFSKSKFRSDQVIGSIYEAKETLFPKLANVKQANKFSGISKEEIVKEISKCNGIWHQFLEFDERKYWDIEEHVAFQLEPEKNPLPSDSTFREDVIIWKTRDVDASQLAKERLENAQRADKKLREKFSKGENKEKKSKKH